MTTLTKKWINDIHQGDAAETLAEMPENSVHCAMTSPPYFGLRDYGVDGQIGLEESLEEYVNNLLDVASELRRVLRDDGSWWLNLGDSYAGSGRGQWTDSGDEPKESYRPDSGELPDRDVRMKRKTKMLVPHRVAIALIDAGWVVRNDVVWAKENPTPHPVKDRLNTTHEMVFHLTPEPDYWYDLEAIREPHKESSLDRNDYAFNTAGVGMTEAPREDREDDVIMDADQACHPNGKNPGDVFELPVKAFPDAHFAVYPPELCEKPIKASCPPKVCAECGTPYERVVEEGNRTVEGGSPALDMDETGYKDRTGNHQGERDGFTLPEREVLGWEQQCECETDETEPGIVLDPFAGAGTTALVAKNLGRRFVGIDLNPEYVAMAQKRVGVTVDEPERLLEDNETNLSAFADGDD